MELEIITIYVICCEFLQAVGHPEDKQCQMSDAEVMTTAIVAMLNFGGNYAQARKWLKHRQYIPMMLSESRFSRRLSHIGHLFVPCFNLIGQYWKEVNPENIYAIDTFPIPVCDNIRISRAKIYHTEAYRGYTASKRRYFYGLKVHMMVTQQGEPVEFFISPGSFSDVACLDQFDFDLPPGSTVYADKIYNDYLVEDCLQEDGDIALSLPFARPIPNDLTHPGNVFCSTTIAKLLKLRVVWLNGYYPNIFTLPMLPVLNLRLFFSSWLFPLASS